MDFISVERSTVHPYRVSDFGVFLEDDAIDLSAGKCWVIQLVMG